MWQIDAAIAGWVAAHAGEGGSEELKAEEADELWDAVLDRA